MLESSVVCSSCAVRPQGRRYGPVREERIDFEMRWIECGVSTATRRVHCNAACRIDIHTQAAITALALTARSLPVRVLPATRFSALQSCPQRVPCLVRCSGGHRRLSAEDPSVLRHGDREYSAEQSCVLRISQLH